MDERGRKREEEGEEIGAACGLGKSWGSATGVSLSRIAGVSAKGGASASASATADAIRLWKPKWQKGDFAGIPMDGVLVHQDGDQSGGRNGDEGADDSGEGGADEQGNEHGEAHEVDGGAS